MAPPKIRLHNNNSSGKLKSISKTTSPPTNQPGPSTSSGSSTTTPKENDQQFQLEIYWCVQQLETTINSGKLNPKQVVEAEKNIKILKSPAQPIIKKRQLMRQLFGDYRTKMAEEEQKMYSVNNRIQFNAKTKPNKKSYFVKKSALLSALQQQQGFQFDFKLDDKLNGLTLKDSDKNEIANLPTSSNSTTNVPLPPPQFQQSSNEFRFNFSVEEDQRKN